MRHKLIFYLGTTILAITSHTRPVVADLPPLPRDPAALGTSPVFLFGLAFVLVVAGISFLLLRRMAKKRDQNISIEEATDEAERSSKQAPDKDH